MDKLTSIKAFTRVVQHGSFAAAARELRLSRSAVSKYVIELELELGAQLLVRTTRVKALMLVSLSTERLSSNQRHRRHEYADCLRFVA